MYSFLILLVTLTLTLDLVSLAAGKTKGKGSESLPTSADESGEDEEYGEIKKENKNKKTGQQHNFWIPTYQGHNPLHRRKISITTSEIEKYDKSIDVSLSGVDKNQTKRYHDKDKQKDVSLVSMPYLLSGENITANKSERYVESLDSGGISVDESKSENTGSSSSVKKVSKTKEIKKTRVLKLKSTLMPKKKEIKTEINKHKKYVEKEITSQFFEELNKATDDEKMTPEYYREMVRAATQNTKTKLGYNKIPKTRKPARKPPPEIIAVNIDSKSLEKTRKEDEVMFQTKHEQFSEDPKDAKVKSKTEKLANVTNKNKSQQNTNKKVKLTNKSSSQFTEEYETEEQDKSLIASENSETSEESVSEDTELHDYSAWSDCLEFNRTARKSKVRKPKTAKLTHTLSPSDIRKWPGKDIKRKADEIRNKEGKGKRKEKGENSGKKGKRNKDYKNEMDDQYDDYDYDYPKKKLRMRTKGEKQHAVRQVSDYLKKMDEQYGGRPGGDKYRPDDKYSRKREDSYERPRDYGGKGRDRKRDRGDGGRWDDRADRRGDRDGRRGDRGGWRNDRGGDRDGRRGGRDSWRDDRGGDRDGRRGGRDSWRDDRRGGRREDRGDRRDYRGGRRDDRGGRRDYRGGRRDDRGGRRDDRGDRRGYRDSRRDDRRGDYGRGRGESWGRGRGGRGRGGRGRGGGRGRRG